jgi:hypothetical protein
LVLIGVKVVALITPTGAIVAKCITEMSARIVRAVDKFTNTLTSHALYSMVRIRINYTLV